MEWFPSAVRSRLIEESGSVGQTIASGGLPAARQTTKTFWWSARDKEGKADDENRSSAPRYFLGLNLRLMFATFWLSKELSFLVGLAVPFFWSSAVSSYSTSGLSS